MKYYVYHVQSEQQDEKLCAFVTNPELFAQHEFGPTKMEFSGLMVEASTIEQAKNIYTSPTASGTIYSCDEPSYTQLARKHNNLEHKIDKMEKTAYAIKARITAAQVAMLIAEINNKSMQLAQEFAQSIRPTNLSVEELYGRIKKQFAQQFIDLPYDDGETRGPTNSKE